MPALDNTELPVSEAMDSSRDLISNPDNNETSKTVFFDPEHTTAQRWAPSEPFAAFIEKNFRRRLTADQVNEIIGESSPAETDAF